jgi:hypothetical protein
VFLIAMAPIRVLHGLMLRHARHTSPLRLIVAMSRGPKRCKAFHKKARSCRSQRGANTLARINKPGPFEAYNSFVVQLKGFIVFFRFQAPAAAAARFGDSEYSIRRPFGDLPRPSGYTWTAKASQDACMLLFSAAHR